MVLNYFENFLALNSAVLECVYFSEISSLAAVIAGAVSSAVVLKIFTFTVETKNF